jgi:hypothetical protein
MRVAVLGSRQHNRFTNGGAEIFDMAGRGKIGAFFLSGGQIDGQANINLVGTGDYPQHRRALVGLVRLGLPVLHLVPRVHAVPLGTQPPHAGASRWTSSARPGCRSPVCTAPAGRWR